MASPATDKKPKRALPTLCPYPLSQDQYGGVGRCDALWYRSPSPFPALATANGYPELVSDPRFKDEEILGSNDAQKLRAVRDLPSSFFVAPVQVWAFSHRMLSGATPTIWVPS
jgi:hypothetical protein